MMKILVPEARAQSRKPANVLSTHRHPFHQRCVRFYAPKPPALAAPFYHAPKTHSFKTRFCRRAQEQLHLSLTGAANEVALDFVVHPANATQVAVTLNGAPVDADCTTATINAYTAQFCVALFSGLAPNTQYTYAVTSSAAARMANLAATGFAAVGVKRLPALYSLLDVLASLCLSLGVLCLLRFTGGLDAARGPRTLGAEDYTVMVTGLRRGQVCACCGAQPPHTPAARCAPQ